MRDVSVNTEWGSLKEVIIGISTGLTVPIWTDEYEFVPLDEQKFVKRYCGKLLTQASPDRALRVNQQLSNLANTLEELNIIVHRPREFSQDETNYLANIRNCTQLLFTRDPILVIDNHVIETAMRDPAERKNRWPLRDVFLFWLMSISRINAIYYPV